MIVRKEKGKFIIEMDESEVSSLLKSIASRRIWLEYLVNKIIVLQLGD